MAKRIARKGRKWTGLLRDTSGAPKVAEASEDRRYKCRNCGHEQMINTNHTGPVIDYCKECSWKPSFGKDQAIPFGGHTYRNFDFVGGESLFKSWDELNAGKQAAEAGETLGAFRQAVTEGMYQVDQAIGHLQEVGADQFPEWVNKLDKAHQALLEISQELNTAYPEEAQDETSDLYSHRKASCECQGPTCVGPEVAAPLASYRDMVGAMDSYLERGANVVSVLFADGKRLDEDKTMAKHRVDTNSLFGLVSNLNELVGKAKAVSQSLGKMLNEGVEHEKAHKGAGKRTAAQGYVPDRATMEDVKAWWDGQSEEDKKFLLETSNFSAEGINDWDALTEEERKWAVQEYEEIWDELVTARKKQAFHAVELQTLMDRESFYDLCETVAVDAQLGYESPEEAWAANPLVSGQSVNDPYGWEKVGSKQAEAAPSGLQRGDRVIDAGNHLGTIVKLPGEEYELPHRPVLIYGRVPEGQALVRFRYTAGGSREELRRIDQLRRAIHRATRKLAWAEGDRVKFTGNPAAAMLYTEGAPPEGTEGTIQTCSGAHGMSIYPDPARKMVFVRFDNGWRGGVYKRDLDLILRKVDRGYEAGQGRHPTTKKPGDPTYSQEWSGVSNAPHAEGASCPNCGGHLHDEDGNFYCPKCDDYVKPVRGSKQAVKSGDIATAMQRGELPNPYVLSEADLGRQIDIVYGMGVVKPFDVGKRVYLRNGYLQMENDDQVRRRKNLLGKQATGEADQELEIEAAGVDTKEFIANAIADLISDNPTERSVAWESIAGLGEMALPYLEEYLGGEFGGEAQMLIKSIKSQMERG